MEVYINGEWGTVCGNSWDPLDSKVVCQQLGYKGVNHTYCDTSQHSFGAGTGWSWLNWLQCTGSEANLLQCPHQGVNRLGCRHYLDVGVVCTNEVLPEEGERMCLCAWMPAQSWLQSFDSVASVCQVNPYQLILHVRVCVCT